MTTYSYQLELNDSEMITLTAALEFYRNHCAEQLAAGIECPYLTHHRMSEYLLSRRFENARMTSTLCRG